MKKYFFNFRNSEFQNFLEFGIYLEILDGPLRRRGAVAVRHISSINGKCFYILGSIEIPCVKIHLEAKKLAQKAKNTIDKVLNQSGEGSNIKLGLGLGFGLFSAIIVIAFIMYHEPEFIENLL